MIYLDNASTTKVDPKVIEAMMPYLTEQYGNPGTIYSFGRDSRKAVEKARAQVASFIGAKPEQIKNIYKLNKIKENLDNCLQKRDEIKSYSQTLVMLIDLILHIIKVRHDNIIDRLCKIAVYKDKREKIIKENADIDEERQKIIDAAKALNPNVRVPGEVVEEEKKEEEKKEEENQEAKEDNKSKEIKEEKSEQNKENKEEVQSKENKETEGENKDKEGEQNEEENKDEIDSAKLAEDLQKFDEEHPKQEVPPDVEYDIDNDYDIDQSEKDTEINNALQAASNAAAEKEKEKDKNKINLAQNNQNQNQNAQAPNTQTNGKNNEVPQAK